MKGVMTLSAIQTPILIIGSSRSSSDSTCSATKPSLAGWSQMMDVCNKAHDGFGTTHMFQ